MASALYDERHGFYSRAPSRAADYFTSVTVHPRLFGTLLARHLDDVWTALGKPRPFRVVELGCGDGALARQIASAARELEWHEHLSYIGVERSAAARAKAHDRGIAAAFVESLDAINAGPSAAVLSNELFDALPVRLLQRDGDDWVELRVTQRDDALAFEPAPAQPTAMSYARRYGQGVPDGGMIEMREGVADIYAGIQRIARRWVMTSIDYGGLDSEVHSSRFPQGTLLAYRRHHASEDVLADPGASDLTAHVNFSELIDAGTCAGATTGSLGHAGRLPHGTGNRGAFAGGAAPSEPLGVGLCARARRRLSARFPHRSWKVSRAGAGSRRSDRPFAWTGDSRSHATARHREGRRMTTRTETDPLGDLEVPASALYGVQTQRAVDNFDISGIGPHPALPCGRR